MRKLLIYSNRMALVVGLLIALTPCGVCHSASANPSATCKMAGMGKMKCCQTQKSHDLFCKVMDQSSLPFSGTRLTYADIPAVPYAGVFPSILRTVVVPLNAVFDPSPPRQLVLRI